MPGKEQHDCRHGKNLVAISLPHTPLLYQSGFSAGGRRRYNVGNLCEGLEGRALGQASESDFQDPLEQLPPDCGNQEVATETMARRYPCSCDQGDDSHCCCCHCCWSLECSVRPWLWQLLLVACKLVTSCRNAESGTAATAPQHPQHWRLDYDMAMTFFTRWKQLKLQADGALLPFCLPVLCVLHPNGGIKLAPWMLAGKEPGKIQFLVFQSLRFRKAY